MVLLSHYFRPEDDEAVMRAQAGDWIDILKGFPQYAIEKACREYLVEEPRRKPTPGAIVELCRKCMPRPVIGESPETLALPKPERTDADRYAAIAIMDKLGFTPKRMELVRKAPLARSIDEAEARAIAGRVSHWSDTATPDDPRWEMLRKSRIAAGMIQDTPKRMDAAE